MSTQSFNWSQSPGLEDPQYDRLGHSLHTVESKDRFDRPEYSCYERIRYESILAFKCSENTFKFVLHVGSHYSQRAQRLHLDRWTANGWQEYLNDVWIFGLDRLEALFEDLTPTEPEEMLAAILRVEELAASQTLNLLSPESDELTVQSKGAALR